MFTEFLNKILEISNRGSFTEQTNQVQAVVDNYEDADIKEIVKEIGTIPECIKASSSEEKLFSKASDIVLARVFCILGLQSSALKERADSADVIARSIHHGYSLVADAKCFRMSRTAKNQKDFKVSALSQWRGDESEYAVLVSPYFQYPKEESQIYQTALSENVCLFSWEHLSILLENNIVESETVTLENIWNSSKMFSRSTSVESSKKCFLSKLHEIVTTKCRLTPEQFEDSMNNLRAIIISRGSQEIDYCQSRIDNIRGLTLDQAISQLIKETKLEEKIEVIRNYISTLEESING